MTKYCDVCGRQHEESDGYHSNCLRKLFGTSTLPSIELSHHDVLMKAQEMAGRMSISGVQPKLSMSREGARLIPVTTGGQYLLKPQTERFEQLPQNENLCMIIAERAGIAVPPHGLFELKDGSPAYIVRRFDRLDDGKKLRCEDFVQILGENDKYSGSIERVGKKLRELSTVPGLDAQFLFERVLLNFLIGNGDAHLKNFSLVEDQDGGLRLAPAYDIVSSKIVIPSETDSALMINGKPNALRRKDFIELGKNMKILPKVLDGILERFQKLKEMMKDEIEHSRLSIELKAEMTSVIEERHDRFWR